MHQRDLLSAMSTPTNLQSTSRVEGQNGSNSGQSKNSTRLAHQHKAAEENVHMGILGGEERDFVTEAPPKRPCGDTTNPDANAKAGVPNSPKLRTDNGSLPSSSSTSQGKSKKNNNPSLGSYQPPAASASSGSSGNSSLSSSTDHEPPHAAQAAVISYGHDRDRSSWWGKMPFWGSNKPIGRADSKEEDLSYRSLGSPYDRARRDASQGHPIRAQPSRDPLAAVTPPPAVPSDDQDSQVVGDAAKIAPVNTIEDQLRQDCTFFYRGIDEEDENSHGGNGNSRRNRLGAAMARRIQRRRRMRPMHAISSPIFNTNDGAQFHARYQQLNQVLDSRRRKPRGGVDMLDYDLSLNIDDEQGQDGNVAGAMSFHSNVSQNVMNVANSTLFYEQHGRFLLRLPRDQVRLVMETELQPGIVSVEQWRPKGQEEDVGGDASKEQRRRQGQHEAHQPVDAVSTPRNPYLTETDPENPQSLDPEEMPREQQRQLAGDNNANDTNDPQKKGGSSFFETQPPLRYVLTVPDDLYRRVVSEMSDSLTSPYCGMGRCRQEDEHVDIRVALGILSVIFIFMFISTLEWPTE